MRYFLFLILILIQVSCVQNPPEPEPVGWSAEWTYTLVTDQYEMSKRMSKISQHPYGEHRSSVTAMNMGLNAQPEKGGLRWLLSNLYRQVNAGKIQAYHTDRLGRPTSSPMSQKEFFDLCHEQDTVIVETLEGDFETVVVSDTTEEKDVKGLGFQQEWMYDQNQHQLHVFPLYSCISKLKLDDITGQYRGLKPLVCFPHEKAAPKFNQRKKHLMFKPEITWASYISMDVMLDDQNQVVSPSKILWEAAGLKGGQNPWEFMDYQPLKSIRNQSLGMILFDQAKAGELELFADQEMLQSVSPQQFQQLILEQDTVTIETLDGDFEERIIQTEIVNSDVSALRVSQIWTYDPKKGTTTSQVPAVALMISKRDPITGEWLGYRPLVWVKLNT